VEEEEEVDEGGRDVEFCRMDETKRKKRATEKSCSSFFWVVAGVQFLI